MDARLFDQCFIFFFQVRMDGNNFIYHPAKFSDPRAQVISHEGRLRDLNAASRACHGLPTLVSSVSTGSCAACISWSHLYSNACSGSDISCKAHFLHFGPVVRTFTIRHIRTGCKYASAEEAALRAISIVYLVLVCEHHCLAAVS